MLKTLKTQVQQATTDGYKDLNVAVLSNNVQLYTCKG